MRNVLSRVKQGEKKPQLSTENRRCPCSALQLKSSWPDPTPLDAQSHISFNGRFVCSRKHTSKDLGVGTEKKQKSCSYHKNTDSSAAMNQGTVRGIF